MSLTSTQSEIAVGYGELGASELGSQFAFFRQLHAMCDFSLPYMRKGVAVDVDPLFTFKRVNGFGKPEYYGAFDYTRVQAGDYLVGADTYFVADVPFPQPPLLVRCNATLAFYRSAPAPVSSSQSKYSTYNGNQANGGKGTLIAQGWPASLLTGSRGEKPTVQLPDSGREPWVAIILPKLPIQLEHDDYVEDDTGHRYQISAVESDRVLRLTAQLAED